MASIWPLQLVNPYKRNWKCGLIYSLKIHDTSHVSWSQQRLCTRLSSVSLLVTQPNTAPGVSSGKRNWGSPESTRAWFVISKRPLLCICVYSDSFMCTSLHDWYQALCINICTWRTELYGMQVYGMRTCVYVCTRMQVVVCIMPWVCLTMMCMNT